MVILGLGSNLGDRLGNLRRALHATHALPDLTVKQVSPVYISEALLPDNAPSDWNKPYLNLAIRCETNLEPLVLLDKLKNIEWSIGRKPEARHWGPRIMDIDILAWDDRVIESERLTVPHVSLQERPFALWPLADVAPRWLFPLSGQTQGKTAAELVEKWGSRFSGSAPFKTRQLYHRIDTPELVGIINVTPDSFSDGGKYLNSEKALSHASQLVSGGSTILDIGAESTAPQATPIDARTEWSRLEPVLELLLAEKNNFILTPKISVDTYHAAVAEKALALGVDWINDQSGANDPAMQELLAQSDADFVVMHSLSLPASKESILPRDQDPVKVIYQWALEKIAALEKAGIKRERIIIDPGIGFGKTADQSLELINHANEFKKLDIRILMGHSRKSFLHLITSLPAMERDLETTIISLALANQKMDYLRVHDAEKNMRGFKIANALL